MEQAIKLKPMPLRFRRLLASIPKGDTSPMSISDLSKRLNMEERTIQYQVNQLIVEYGIPICSRRTINAGIFIPLNEEQRQAGLVTIRASQQSLSRRIAGVEDADLNRVKEYEAKYSDIEEERRVHGEQMVLWDLYDQYYI